MPGTIREGAVLVEDPAKASQIHNRGAHGTPVSGGGLRLELEEAAFLVEAGRLEVLGSGGGRTLEVSDILREGTRADPCFDIVFLVYRDLRGRGYVVKRFSRGLFKVFERGEGRGSHSAKHMLFPVDERARLDVPGVLGLLDDARFTRKGLLLGVADEEGDLTYYEMSLKDPQGRKRAASGPAIARGAEANDAPSPVTLVLMGDRGFVFGAAEAQELHGEGFFGKRVGETLQLSLMETLHLMKSGRVVVLDAHGGERLDEASIAGRGAAMGEDLDLRRLLYEDMRGRGLIVKTGFKYGAHFRVYRDDPDIRHSEYLLHGFAPDQPIDLPLLSRSVRVAHGVRKSFLMGIPARGSRPVTYVQVKRIRP